MNTIAQYIARKGITKHMDHSAATAVWRDLRRDGWRAEGGTLVKVIDRPEHEAEHHFIFERVGSKVKVSYRELCPVGISDSTREEEL